jgi:hypothetical protein
MLGCPGDRRPGDVKQREGAQTHGIAFTRRAFQDWLRARSCLSGFVRWRQAPPRVFETRLHDEIVSGAKILRVCSRKPCKAYDYYARVSLKIQSCGNVGYLTSRIGGMRAMRNSTLTVSTRVPRASRTSTATSPP